MIKTFRRREFYRLLFKHYPCPYMEKRLQLILLIFISSLSWWSCSRQITNVRQKDQLVIFPSPPDTTRIQYLTSISTSLDITGKRNAFTRFVLGEDKPLPIVKPYGLALGKSKLYVCDASIGGLELIDFQDQQFSYFIPKGRGQLKMPVNCVVDNDGKLYVADASRRQVVVFNDKCEYVTAFGEANEAKPTDVGLSEDKIWVTDADHHAVHVYQKSSQQLLFSFPDSLDPESYLYQPVNIRVTPDRVYVTDFGDFKIKAYNHKGEFISAVGGFGNSYGQFVRPKGIDVDRDGILYVVDAGFENVQMFNSKGQLLMFFGGPYKGPGDMWLPAKVLVDYDHLSYFEPYVDKDFTLKYLIFVTNQYGPDKINVYGAVNIKK
jgi:sugar lactone lactonase YvrE